jgi:hypothetical protein
MELWPFFMPLFTNVLEGVFSEIRYPLATPSNNKNTPCGRCAKSYTHV